MQYEAPTHLWIDLCIVVFLFYSTVTRADQDESFIHFNLTDSNSKCNDGFVSGLDNLKFSGLAAGPNNTFTIKIEKQTANSTSWDMECALPVPDKCDKEKTKLSCACNYMNGTNKYVFSLVMTVTSNYSQGKLRALLLYQHKNKSYYSLKSSDLQLPYIYSMESHKPTFEIYINDQIISIEKCSLKNKFSLVYNVTSQPKLPNHLTLEYNGNTEEFREKENKMITIENLLDVSQLFFTLNVCGQEVRQWNCSTIPKVSDETQNSETQKSGFSLLMIFLPVGIISLFTITFCTRRCNRRRITKIPTAYRSPNGELVENAQVIEPLLNTTSASSSHTILVPKSSLVIEDEVNRRPIKIIGSNNQGGFTVEYRNTNEIINLTVVNESFIDEEDETSLSSPTQFENQYNTSPLESIHQPIKVDKTDGEECQRVSNDPNTSTNFTAATKENIKEMNHFKDFKEGILNNCDQEPVIVFVLEITRDISPSAILATIVMLNPSELQTSEFPVKRITGPEIHNASLYFQLRDILKDNFGFHFFTLLLPLTKHFVGDFIALINFFEKHFGKNVAKMMITVVVKCSKSNLKTCIKEVIKSWCLLNKEFQEIYSIYENRISFQLDSENTDASECLRELASEAKLKKYLYSLKDFEMAFKEPKLNYNKYSFTQSEVSQENDHEPPQRREQFCLTSTAKDEVASVGVQIITKTKVEVDINIDIKLKLRTVTDLRNHKVKNTELREKTMPSVKSTQSAFECPEVQKDKTQIIENVIPEINFKEENTSQKSALSKKDFLDSDKCYEFTNSSERYNDEKKEIERNFVEIQEKSLITYFTKGKERNLHDIDSKLEVPLKVDENKPVVLKSIIRAKTNSQEQIHGLEKDLSGTVDKR